MRKHLPLLAALALTGCTTHSQFKAAYLEKFAEYDCQSLSVERASSEAQVLHMRGKRSAISAAERRGVRVFYIDHIGPPGSISSHERRMRQHARHEAVLNLQLAHGCQSEHLNPKANNPKRANLTH